VVNWPSAWIRRDLKLVVGFHGEQRIRTADGMDQDAIRRGLKDIERYIETVERGQTRNVKVRERAKAMMGETLLHMFAAPFRHERNKRKRRAYPRLAEGPPDLVVTGGSGNGKRDSRNTVSSSWSAKPSRCWMPPTPSPARRFAGRSRASCLSHSCSTKF